MFIDEVTHKISSMIKPDAIFKIQNVYEYMRTNYDGKEIVQLVSMPSFRPPFKTTWWEFTEKNYIDTPNISIGIMTILDDNLLLGKENENIREWVNKKYPTCKHLLYAFITAQTVEKIMGFFLPLDENGIALSNGWGTLSEFRDSAKANDVVAPWLLTIILALSFLNCKNVLKVENYFPDKLLKARQRKNKPYFEKYYTLQIEHMKKALQNEGQINKMGINYAFHICRGHFKTYDERPLFGKVTGTFWVPAHVRGDPSIGKIKKDYEIVV